MSTERGKLRKPRLAQDDDAIGVGDRQWLQQHTVHHAENRCRRSQTQGKRRERDEAEDRVPAQGAQREREIVQHGVPRRHWTGEPGGWLTAVLLDGDGLVRGNDLQRNRRRVATNTGAGTAAPIRPAGAPSTRKAG